MTPAVQGRTLTTMQAAKAQWIADNLKAGELYTGIILGLNGLPDHHLILLADEAADVTWQKAVAWATKVGGDLPTRREQSLLFANLKSEFQPRWYWSREQRAGLSDCAWLQDFISGGQGSNGMSSPGRARAVRRLEI